MPVFALKTSSGAVRGKVLILIPKLHLSLFHILYAELETDYME